MKTTQNESTDMYKIKYNIKCSYRLFIQIVRIEKEQTDCFRIIQNFCLKSKCTYIEKEFTNLGK